MSTPTFPNYINGEWVEGDTFENRSPANIDDLVGNFVKGTAEDIDRAAAAAQEAFGAWSSMNAPTRGKYLFKVSDILESKLDQLAEEMTREEGKTLPEAKGETMRSINIFRYYGGEGSRLSGFQVPSERPRVHMFAIRRALGVVGLVTPWNFPSAIPAWKLAPALICGNTVIMKPASAAPLCSWRLIEACHEAGIPKGVVNYVAGSGSKIGNALVDAKPLKAISFTGSCEVGALLHDRASKRHLKIQLEMGGKNPTIVLADCNLDEAVANVINAAFFSTGQKCTATSRCIVEESIYEKFIDALVAATRKLKVGNGLEPGVHIGPAIDQNQLETNIRYVEIGRKEAGDPIIGGNRLTGGDYDKGFYFEPTIFRDVTSEMTIAQEEVFGPVLTIIKATDFKHAMKLANDVPFGLSASVQTSNISRVFEFIHGMEAGLLTINLPSAGVEYQLPFGGTKDSSFGPKEQGLTALDFYSDYKTVYLKY